MWPKLPGRAREFAAAAPGRAKRGVGTGATATRNRWWWDPAAGECRQRPWLAPGLALREHGTRVAREADKRVSLIGGPLWH
jgi:hypothetical protein